ncbi:hypothetical protein D3C84_670040 [compost metagenome]
MHDAQQQHRQCQQACAGNALQDKAEPDQEHLNEGDTHDAERYRTDGCGAQGRHAWASVRPADPRGNLYRSTAAGLTVGHENPGDDQRKDKGQETHADTGQFAQQAEAETFDLRDVFGCEPGKIGGRLLPQCIHLVTYQRPLRHRLRRRRNSHALLLDDAHRTFHGIGNRRAQQVDRHHQDDDRHQHDHRRNAAVLLPQRASESLLQRIQRDRQDHRPQHQVTERAEYLETEQHQHNNQSGADQHIQQSAGQGLL